MQKYQLSLLLFTPPLPLPPFLLPAWSVTQREKGEGMSQYTPLTLSSSLHRSVRGGASARMRCFSSIRITACTGTGIDTKSVLLCTTIGIKIRSTTLYSSSDTTIY